MRLLVVEDDRAMRFLLERAMSRIGHEVEAFAAAEQALDALRAPGAAYDAVITDQSLPGLEGVEFARALREIHPDLPVLLVSGHVTEDLRARAADAGVWRVLEKPVSVKALSEHVDLLLSGRG